MNVFDTAIPGNANAVWDPYGELAQRLNDRSDDERDYTAVIDIGSGSARAVVMHVHPGGGIEVLAQQSVNLNLMSHVDANGMLDEAGVASTLDAMEDFVLVARGYGAKAIHAIATAAIRESVNSSTITDTAMKRFGVPLRIIAGEEEAAYCFMGAMHGLHVSDGLLADVGGGSTEIVEFSSRALTATATLPMGSLRIANRFGLTDRPEANDLAGAFEYVNGLLAESRVPKLPRWGALVGSGGTVRLLSKLDRRRAPYPIVKMHGYEIEIDDLSALTERLAQLTRQERAAIPGMNRERSHSVVGGAVIALALARHTGSDRILVSGQGLREGLARNPGVLDPHRQICLPSLKSVQVDSLTDLTSRFAPKYSQRGTRRAAIAGTIANAVWAGRHKRLTGALQCAALLVDVGNAIDFYNRMNRAASIIVRTDLPGFTHQESAYIAAILLVAESGRLLSRFRNSRLLRDKDRHRIDQAAAILNLSDELESRLPPDCGAQSIVARRNDGGIIVKTPVWSANAVPAIRSRWDKVFREELLIVGGE